jgi:sugar lactone lactonase YvrE
MNLRFWPAALVALALAACSAGSSTTPIAPGYGESTQSMQAPFAHRAPVRNNLYVANENTVTVYGASSVKPLRTYAKVSPLAMAIGPSGNLYVADSTPNSSSGMVRVYHAGTTKLAQTLTQGLSGPHALAIDSQGTVYVANAYIGVIEYLSNQTAEKRKIPNFFPVSLALDSAQNLYVGRVSSPYGGKGASVRVFKSVTGAELRTITAGVGNPTSLAFDTAGNLYVANPSGSTVTVYAPGKTAVLRTIKGAQAPYAIALDASNDLFVADTPHSYVKVYKPGSNVPSRTITNGIKNPIALAIDSSGDLFVANSTNVTMYKPGASTPSRTITTGVNAPDALVFGP